MIRWACVFLLGLLLTSEARGLAGNASGPGRLPEFGNQPFGQRAPTTPPYVTYLPLVNHKYISGYVSPFGVDMYLGNSAADGQAQMQAAGSGWETVEFLWSSVEPSAPVSGTHTYNWSAFDAVVARAQASGMSLFVLFTANPSWAAELGGGPVTPTHVADLNNMAAAAVERYDGDGVNDAPGNPVIKYWSFYAEPDNNYKPAAQAAGKGWWGDNPNGYGDMIAGVAAAMHAVNPNVVVMIGGLAYDFFTPTGHYVKSFLGGVLDRLNTAHGGAAASLGAIAFHYYPINSDWPTIKEKTAEIRSILSAHGAANLPLIVPEMGFWSDTVSNPPEWSSTPVKQARVLVEMFVRGLSVGIKQMSWFAVFDYGPGTEAHGLFFGNDLTNPKPSYAAYGVLTSELYGAHYSNQLSLAGVEGYVFSMSGGPQKTVLWATRASANITLHQTCLRRVDYVGNVIIVHDGDATWDKDTTAGQITLKLFQDVPLYVSAC